MHTQLAALGYLLLAASEASLGVVAIYYVCSKVFFPTETDQAATGQDNGPNPLYIQRLETMLHRMIEAIKPILESAYEIGRTEEEDAICAKAIKAELAGTRVALTLHIAERLLRDNQGKTNMTRLRKEKILFTVQHLIAAERTAAVRESTATIDEIADEMAKKEPRLGGVAFEMKSLTSKMRLAYTPETQMSLEEARRMFQESLTESLLTAALGGKPRNAV